MSSTNFGSQSWPIKALDKIRLGSRTSSRKFTALWAGISDVTPDFQIG
jgi:hypothetical protein